MFATWILCLFLLMIAPYLRVEYEEVSGLSDTVRGEGGFGSTGRK